MSGIGELRHEVLKEDGTGLPLLHVYLPEGLTSSDVEVTTGSNPDVAEVCIEHIATGSSLCMIQLQEYTVHQDDAVAKFNKKQRRFMIRLRPAVPSLPASAELPAVPDVAETVSGATCELSAEPSAASPASPVKAPPTSSNPAAAPWSPPPVGTGNSFGLLDNDDVSDDDGDGGGGEAAEVGKKKKKKKGKKAGARSEGQEVEAPTSNGNHAEGNADGAEGGGGSSGDEAETAPAATGDGATGAAKKKRKKKKKKGGAGAAAMAAAAEGCAEAEVNADEEAAPRRSLSPPSSPLPEPSSSLPSAPNSVPVSAPASAPASAPISKHASRAVFVDMVEDFGEESIGSFEIGAAVAHDPLLGPAVQHALGKVHVKGEDKSLEAPTNTWRINCLEGAVTPVSVFGIFDGHGGRMAAQHAAKQLLPLVARFAERAVGPVTPSTAEQLVAEGYLPAKQHGEDATGPIGSGDDNADMERARVAAVQDALVARLPKALHAGFVQCDEEVISRFKTSGTTATLAVQVGWELLVANVGDSLAYLDTGSEIVAISTNHRVSESTEEQERVLKAGGRIKPAKYGEDDGPEGEAPGSATPHEGQQLRVWPGGINMTRTIGDDPAKGLLIPEPSVRQVSLPVTGARLIIASDGLWDAVNAKTIIGQLRTSNAREAASKAAVYAMRNKKHDDDVTVVVADFVPRQSDAHVLGLLKRPSGPAAAALAALAAAGLKEERAVQSWRPLDSHSESWRERHRAHRLRAAAYLHELYLAEKVEEETAEELERQRRMIVAPAAGTAGAGTAVRLPPVSDTYRELAELKVPLEALNDDEDEWTQVDAKKKETSSFDMRKELIRAARPGEGQQPRSPATGANGSREDRPKERERGGSNRRERRERGGADRERWPPRRERDGGGGAAASGAAAAASAASNAAEAEAVTEPQQQQPFGQQQQPQQQQVPRGERWERHDRRDRGGRGGRGREGGATGGRGALAPMEARESGGAGAATAAPAAPAAQAMPSGIVKAGGYLCVPRSLLTGGSGSGGGGGVSNVAAASPMPAPPADPVSGSGADAAGGGKLRREREFRGGGGRNRRDDAAPQQSAAAQQDGAEGGQHVTDPAAAARLEDHNAAPSSFRRTQQRRRPREREAAVAREEAAAAAAASVVSGLPTGASVGADPGRPAQTPAPAAQTHAPSTSSSAPVVDLESGSGHHPRRQQQQHRYGAASQTAPPQAAAQQQPMPEAASVGSMHGRRLGPQGQAAHAMVGAPASASPAQPPTQRPQSHQQAQPVRQQQQTHQHAQQPHQQQQKQPQQQRAAMAAAAPPPPAVPTYAGPLDFGAGFGPGGSMWPPSGPAGQYGGFSANGEQRPPDLNGGRASHQRSPSEVAAAAAAAAAAAVARKAAAATRGGGATGGGGGGGGYAQGRN